MEEVYSVYLSKAMRYCAGSEQCVYTVSKKLKEWGVGDAEADYILGELVVNGFISEERYASSFARGKFRMLRWGKVKIAAHLRQNRVAEVNIRLALKEISDDEYRQVLHQLTLKKLDSFPKGDRLQNRKKLMAYLASKGFETNLIYEEINSLDI
jgi:regulatory protein